MSDLIIVQPEETPLVITLGIPGPPGAQGPQGPAGPGATGLKAGVVLGASFSGTPKKAQVTFDTPYADTAYSVLISGEDARSWSYEQKTAEGFVISANAATALSGEVSWIAITEGET